MSCDLTYLGYFFTTVTPADTVADLDRALEPLSPDIRIGVHHVHGLVAINPAFKHPTGIGPTVSADRLRELLARLHPAARLRAVPTYGLDVTDEAWPAGRPRHTREARVLFAEAVIELAGPFRPDPAPAAAAEATDPTWRDRPPLL